MRIWFVDQPYKRKLIYWDMIFDEERSGDRANFESDDLPGIDDYDGEKAQASYIRSFDTAIECANNRVPLSTVLQKIHESALGEVNWKKAMAELENDEFALKTEYSSGSYRPEMTTRLTLAHARKGIVYDIPRSEQAQELIKELDDFLERQIDCTERCSDEYYDLAAAVSILTFISQPFLGGNKRAMRPEISYILTRGGLTGRWLDGDENFKQVFKDTWADLVAEFQKTIDDKSAEDISDYDEVWCQYWKEKIITKEILKDPGIHTFAKAIKFAPYLGHSLQQKVVGQS